MRTWNMLNLWYRSIENFYLQYEIFMEERFSSYCKRTTSTLCLLYIQSFKLLNECGTYLDFMGTFSMLWFETERAESLLELILKNTEVLESLLLVLTPAVTNRLILFLHLYCDDTAFSWMGFAIELVLPRFLLQDCWLTWRPHLLASPQCPIVLGPGSMSLSAYTSKKVPKQVVLPVMCNGGSLKCACPNDLNTFFLNSDLIYCIIIFK